MAVTVLGNGGLKMTAVADTWPDKIKLCGGVLCITTTNAGTFELTNAAGDVIVRSGAVQANDNYTEDLIGWVDGVIVTSIPTGGTIILQHD
jgi:hypothetical protein